MWRVLHATSFMSYGPLWRAQRQRVSDIRARRNLGTFQRHFRCQLDESDSLFFSPDTHTHKYRDEYNQCIEKKIEGSKVNTIMEGGQSLRDTLMTATSASINIIFFFPSLSPLLVRMDCDIFSGLSLCRIFNERERESL